MDFIVKMVFYILYGLSCLLCMFFFFSAINELFYAYGKKSESIIMSLAGLIVATGLYFSYQIIKNSDRYLYCSGLLGICWLIAIVVVIIGLFFFNGPLHWQ